MLGYEFPTATGTKRPILRRLMWIGFHGLRALVLCLPYGLAQWLGAVLGQLGYWALWSCRRLTLQHLAEALGGDTTPRQRRRIARRLFRHLGMNFVEWLSLSKLNAENIRRHVDAPGAVERVRAALAQGRGVIMLSAHLGNWELLADYFGLTGEFRGGVVARRLRYPEYEAFLTQARRVKGVETFDRDASFRDLLRRLRDNQCIGILPDQDVDSVDGVFVDFFGRPAYTPVGPVALALAGGAVLLPSYIVREGRRHRIIIDEPMELVRTGDRQRDLIENTQRWSRITESHIRQYPDQWVWMHRRWKTAPTTPVR